MKITWHDGRREPRNPPNPDYPDGIDIVLHASGQPPSVYLCKAALPYPARRIGHYLIECERCGKTAIVTTAGRRDDPRSLTMACGEQRRDGESAGSRPKSK